MVKGFAAIFSLIPTEEIDLKSLGLGSTTLASIITELKRMYGIG